jgi:hypothetical protein
MWKISANLGNESSLAQDDSYFRRPRLVISGKKIFHKKAGETTMTNEPAKTNPEPPKARPEEGHDSAYVALEETKRKKTLPS